MLTNTIRLIFVLVLLLTDHRGSSGWSEVLDSQDRKNAVRFARTWVDTETQWESIPEWNPNTPRVPRANRNPITHARCGDQKPLAEILPHLCDEPCSVPPRLRFNPTNVRYCQVQTGDDHNGDRWIMLCTTEPQPTRQCIGIMTVNPDSSVFDS